jgi:hypothetical protein
VQKTDSIDIINIGLMFLSLAIALTIPFQLFLFSYIILGPLHYMTEIGWLSERNFFLREKVSKWPLFILGAITSAIVIFLGIRESLHDRGYISELPPSWDANLGSAITSFIFIAFVSTLIFIFFKRFWYRVGLILLLLIATVFIAKVPWFIVVFGIMIPTLIHTTIFTGAFLLQGAMKNNRSWGYLSFVVFILCHILIFLMPISQGAAVLTDWIKEIYLAGEFYVLNYNLYAIFYNSSGDQLALDGAIGLKLQAFIAFAYTYHYLNWFSKTEVIKWHLIPRKWMVATAFVWVASVSLHLIDIKLGITAIGLISLMHVFLEFPLNHESFIFIGRSLLRK